MDGQRGVLVTIYKTGNASTLDIVNQIKAKLPQIAAALPPQLVITPLFDQSIFVRAAVQGVVREGLIAACLTALMILLFLGSWRSTVIIAISIPLSVLVSIIVLERAARNHQHHDPRRSGARCRHPGRRRHRGNRKHQAQPRPGQGDHARAILDGAQQIAVPALVSTLCICIVFVPMFFLTGVAKFLFVPLAEAVVFAMLASYLLSRTLVPTLAMYLLQGPSRRGIRHGQRHFFALPARLRARFRAHARMAIAAADFLPRACLDVRRCCFCCSAWLRCPSRFCSGSDFFPSVDAGLIRLHMRARAGQRVEETAREIRQVDNLIRDVDSAERPRQHPRQHRPVQQHHQHHLQQFRRDRRVRRRNPDRSQTRSLTCPRRYYIDQLRERLAEEFPGTQFFFQPADIVSQILNFGVPAPVDIQLIGTDQQANYRIAQQINRAVQLIPGAVDVHVQQLFSAPTLYLDVDRTRAQTVGLSAAGRGQQPAPDAELQLSDQSFVLGESRQRHGIQRRRAGAAIQNGFHAIARQYSPFRPPARGRPQQVLSNLAKVKSNVEPALISHYNNQPMIDIYASVEGRDLGGVDSDIRKVMSRFQRSASARHADGSSRPGRHHDFFVSGLGRGRAGRYRAGLSS